LPRCVRGARAFRVPRERRERGMRSRGTGSWVLSRRARRLHHRHQTRKTALSVVAILCLFGSALVVGPSLASASGGGVTLSVSASPVSAPVGTGITYTYNATNDTTTAYPAADGRIVDDACPTVAITSASDSSFDPGDTWTFRCARVLVASDPDPLVNHAQAQVRASSASPWTDSGAAASASVDITTPPAATT